MKKGDPDTVEVFEAYAHAHAAANKSALGRVGGGAGARGGGGGGGGGGGSMTPHPSRSQAQAQAQAQALVLVWVWVRVQALVRVGARLLAQLLGLGQVLYPRWLLCTRPRPRARSCWRVSSRHPTVWPPSSMEEGPAPGLALALVLALVLVLVVAQRLGPTAMPRRRRW